MDIAHDSQIRSPSLNCWPAISQSAEIVRPSPGAGVKKRRNSSVAGLSRVSRSADSRVRSSGWFDSHSSERAVSAVVVSNPPPMSSAMIPSNSKSGGTAPLISAVASASMSPGLGFALIPASWPIMSSRMASLLAWMRAMSGELGEVYTEAWIGST